MRATEIRNLNSTVDSLKGVNEELKVRLFDVSDNVVLIDCFRISSALSL